MNKQEAQQLIYNALISYVDDCAGRDTEEAQELEKAWELVKNPELTIRVHLSESDLQDLQNFEEFEWRFPTQEDSSQQVNIQLFQGDEDE
jgi:hypothetical protein